MPRRLSIKGGFTVDGDHHRHLDQQASRLGFTDLRACLQGLLEDGWTIPQLADHLNTTHQAIRHAITDHDLRQPPRREQLARQRRHAAQQRAAARVADLGFGSVRAYLVDRLATRAWTLAKVVGELGVAPSTLRRLLDEQQVRRVGPTGRHGRSSAARHAWPSLASRGWRGTCGTGLSPAAGRCGGCASNSGWVTGGWTSSWPGSD